jgi:sulfoxide reductase catalytic subunit YedY
VLIRVRGANDVSESEVTDPERYVRRRELLLAAAGLGATVLAGCGPTPSNAAPADPPAPLGAERSASYSTDEKATRYEDATSYNNFYELGVDKDDPAANAGDLRTEPWSVAVSGLVRRKGERGVEDLLRGIALEERVYRLRCVEAWSMVIPWIGVPLSSVLARLEPEADARFVELRTLYDPERMPGQRRRVLDWPYREGLRMDEAMHPLTLLAVGMYGRELPAQNGAPLRLVVPWKYGFKSIKSIVSIALVREQPATTWSMESPDEYGFYANVNPEVDHPRWSQKHERRIGEFLRRPTLPFNGYAEQVASLYAGMDLDTHF